MNFCETMALRFRKQGLSENEIRIRLSRYYLFSKMALGLFSLAFILIALPGSFKTENIFVIVLFMIWFAVCLMLFLQLRKCTRK